MIDFATLQALTILEGVVTEIKDASGRVIWALANGLPGTFYLRPSADISLGHPVVPDTLTAGYLAISEEVSDGTASYIGFVSPEADKSATSTFRMSLNEALRIKRILSATFIFSGVVSKVSVSEDSDKTAECRCTIYVGGSEVFVGRIYKGRNLDGSDNVDTITNADMSNLVSVLNSYISANGAGNLPEILIEITNSAEAPYVGSKSTSYTSSYVSQIAIALECE